MRTRPSPLSDVLKNLRAQRRLLDRAIAALEHIQADTPMRRRQKRTKVGGKNAVTGAQGQTSIARVLDFVSPHRQSTTGANRGTDAGDSAARKSLG
jgi:hypothetical protein